MDALYADFLPKQIECLGRYSSLIAGAPGTAEGLRWRGIRIGSTTGYTRTVKIGDTPSDIEEGLNAGMWTIGVTRTGNEVGLTKEEWNSATVPEPAAVIARARKRLLDAGAHYLVASAGECLDTIDEIAGRLSSGERP
jgi:phosphonoacetaldehyde hydrolase